MAILSLSIVQSRLELIHGWEPGFLDSIDSNFSKNNLARFRKAIEIFVLVVAFECAFEIINRTCRRVITNPSSKCRRWGHPPLPIQVFLYSEHLVHRLRAPSSFGDRHSKAHHPPFIHHPLFTNIIPHSTYILPSSSINHTNKNKSPPLITLQWKIT